MIFNQPVAIEQCAVPSQDIIISVSGKSEEIALFIKDVVSGGTVWRIIDDKASVASRSLVMRANATIPYAAVMAATDNAQYRLITARVTFAAPTCAA
jgi:hypothetical protein